MLKSRASNAGPSERRRSKDGADTNLWLSMLDSVNSGKRLPEKQLIVLGGLPDQQQEFLATLASDAPKVHQQDRRKKPPIANQYALGYTYQDVLDADHEDILARLSIYLLSDPTPAFSSLLKPLFTPQTIPETLLVVLLDWNEPWSWARQLKAWISMILSITRDMNTESAAACDQIMKEWQQRKRGASTYDTGKTDSTQEPNVILPLGDGEWDAPLGLPICVVCQNTDRIGSLEIEQDWREEEFDYVLQFLRTVLLKHGASLVYTSTTAPNFLPSVIHASLGIQSLLKKYTIKHNVIDRDKILVPPNWDSFGKIRVIREGFDVEKISAAWSVDLHGGPTTTDGQSGPVADTSEDYGAVAIYESIVSDPYQVETTDSNTLEPSLEVSTPNHQEFLASQMAVIERLKSEEEQTSGSRSSTTLSGSLGATDRMRDQIGPVQVNMGGIQVDADDMLRKLKSNQRDSSASAKRGEGHTDSPASASMAATPDRELKAQNENLHNFFAGLMKRGASGSPRNTPGTEGKKAAAQKESSKDEEGVKRLFTKD